MAGEPVAKTRLSLGAAIEFPAKEAKHAKTKAK
jgi:hypothetical protein